MNQEHSQSMHLQNPEWTQEEAELSTPYSDLETWERIVLGQLLSGKSRYRGAPGLWERMKIQTSSLTEPEKTSLYLALVTQQE